MLCREQVAQLRDIVDEIHALDAELVVVGNGRPDQAKQFAEERELSFPVLTDPELRAYAAAKLRRGITTTFGIKGLKTGLRALSHGNVQGRTQGDPWQQGGVFVITPENRVAFAHVSEEAGDHPETTAVLGALRRVAGSPPPRGASPGSAGNRR